MYIRNEQALRPALTFAAGAVASFTYGMAIPPLGITAGVICIVLALLFLISACN